MIDGPIKVSESRLARQSAELSRLHTENVNLRERLDAMMPLFQEARDALCAITLSAAKLHKISPTLADRMDAVGIPARWAQRHDRAGVHHD